MLFRIHELLVSVRERHARSVRELLFSIHALFSITPSAQVEINYAHNC